MTIKVIRALCLHDNGEQVKEEEEEEEEEVGEWRR